MNATRLLAAPASILALSLCSALSLVAGQARAQTGFALDRFEPAAKGSAWFVLDSLDLRGAARPRSGSSPTTRTSRSSSSIRTAPSGATSSGTSCSSTSARASSSPTDFAWPRTSPSPPVRGRRRRNAERHVVRATEQRGAGDLRLDADVRLFGVYGGPITVALGGQVYLPTGGSIVVRQRRERARRAAPARGRGARHRRVRRVGGLHGPRRRGRLRREPDGRRARARRGGGPAPGRPALAPRTGGLRVHRYHGLQDGLRAAPEPARGPLGAHVTAGSIRFGAGGGTGLTQGFGSPGPRRRLDRVRPRRSARRPRIAITTASSTPRTRAPTIPGVRTDDPTTNGCPPPAPAADRDNDGVLDAEDACPDVPGVRDRRSEDERLPARRDDDGILDTEDACPDVPGVRTDDPKTNGCPADRPRQGRHPRRRGRLPRRARARRIADPKKNGCPQARSCSDGRDQDPRPGEVQDRRAPTSCPESDAILGAVAEGPRASTPRSRRSRSRATPTTAAAPRYNKKLSERARGVRREVARRARRRQARALVERGLRAATGPSTRTTTDEGRQNNRRVEFHILEGAIGPSGGASSPARRLPRRRRARPRQNDWTSRRATSADYGWQPQGSRRRAACGRLIQSFCPARVRGVRGRWSARGGVGHRDGDLVARVRVGVFRRGSAPRRPAARPRRTRRRSSTLRTERPSLGRVTRDRRAVPAEADVGHVRDGAAPGRRGHAVLRVREDLREALLERHEVIAPLGRRLPASRIVALEDARIAQRRIGGPASSSAADASGSWKAAASIPSSRPSGSMTRSRAPPEVERHRDEDEAEDHRGDCLPARRALVAPELPRRVRGRAQRRPRLGGGTGGRRRIRHARAQDTFPLSDCSLAGRAPRSSP